MPDDPSRRPGPTPIERYVAALTERHLASLSRVEFLRAARALSARYVETRAALPDRSPLDSAGKRAAFALLFGPIHFAATTGVVEGLGLAPGHVDRVIDLGCGTGVASAAWAMAMPAGRRPAIAGVDSHPWALTEAAWTWKHFTLRADGRRGDLVTAVDRLTGARRDPLAGTAIVCGWSVNELPPPARARALTHLLRAADRGARVLVLEPLSRRAVPWWPEWSRAVRTAGGRDDEWHLPNTLPAGFRQLDRDAGFVRDELGVRSLLAG